MSCRGSESAGLCGLRKQVTEVKEAPLEFRRKKAQVSALREERGKAWACLREGGGMHMSAGALRPLS